MGRIGQEQDRGNRRNDFPELAKWVDVLRETFGPELGGALVSAEGSRREWGDEPPRQGSGANADVWLWMGSFSQRSVDDAGRQVDVHKNGERA
jgi:hypothetical protein